MDETSLSLLDRLRSHPSDSTWRKMVDLYTPLIRGWLRRFNMSQADVDDIVQEVLSVVFRKLPDFERNPQVGSFRAWLRTITVNCLRQFLRSPKSRRESAGNADFVQVLDSLEDPHSGLSRAWDEEHDRHVTQYLLESIRPHFQPATWQAFQRLAVEGANPQQVADELKMTVNAVLIAKSRVLRRLREEGQGLIDA